MTRSTSQIRSPALMAPLTLITEIVPTTRHIA
jgi:hypothetical protein